MSVERYRFRSNYPLNKEPICFAGPRDYIERWRVEPEIKLPDIQPPKNEEVTLYPFVTIPVKDRKNQ